MNLEYLKELLLIKARKEQNKYIEELKKLPPEKILEKAYEKVMRDDIVTAIEYASLSEQQLSALNKTKYPVAACYDEWRKTDNTYMDRLMESVYECSDKLIKAEEQQKNKKRQEPER